MPSEGLAVVRFRACRRSVSRAASRSRTDIDVCVQAARRPLVLGSSARVPKTGGKEGPRGMTGALLDPSDHPDHEVRKALKKLVKRRWILRKEGHWGRLYCPCDNGGCTTISVGGSPENPEREAVRITRIAARCPLKRGDPRRSLAGRRKSIEGKRGEGK